LGAIFSLLFGLPTISPLLGFLEHKCSVAAQGGNIVVPALETLQVVARRVFGRRPDFQSAAEIERKCPRICQGTGLDRNEPLPFEVQ